MINIRVKCAPADGFCAAGPHPSDLTSLNDDGPGIGCGLTARQSDPRPAKDNISCGESD